MSENDLAQLPAGICLHSYRIPRAGIRKKVIYHFSDVHLTEYDALSTQEEKQDAVAHIRFWETTRREFADNYAEPYTNAQLRPAGAHLAALLAQANRGDALVMTGDICDYISGANLRLLEAQLGKLSTPFMALCGNHENAREIPEGYIYSAVKHSVQTLDLGDLLIFGIDNSLRSISPYQLGQLKAALDTGKPLIIAMHVPIMTEGNAAKLQEAGEYFQLNHQDAGPEVHEFIALIKENSHQILAVLAGHLHFADNTQLAPGLTQYVSTQGVLGNLNRYEIGE